MRRKLLAFGIPALMAGSATTPRGGAVSDTDVAITHVAVIDVDRGRVVPDQTVLLDGNTEAFAFVPAISCDNGQGKVDVIGDSILRL